MFDDDSAKAEAERRRKEEEAEALRAKGEQNDPSHQTPQMFVMDPDTNEAIKDIFTNHLVNPESTKVLSDIFKNLGDKGLLKPASCDIIDGTPPQYEIREVPSHGESMIFQQRLNKDGKPVVLPNGEPVIDVLFCNNGQISGGHFPEVPGTTPNYGPKTMEAALAANNKSQGPNVQQALHTGTPARDASNDMQYPRTKGIGQQTSEEKQEAGWLQDPTVIAMMSATKAAYAPYGGTAQDATARANTIRSTLLQQTQLPPQQQPQQPQPQRQQQQSQPPRQLPPRNSQ